MRKPKIYNETEEDLGRINADCFIAEINEIKNYQNRQKHLNRFIAKAILVKGVSKEFAQQYKQLIETHEINYNEDFIIKLIDAYVN